MYPAWSFWAGGPAISLYPTGLGRWDQHRKSINDASHAWPWSEKKSKGFFRGSRTSSGKQKRTSSAEQYTVNHIWLKKKKTRLAKYSLFI